MSERRRDRELHAPERTGDEADEAVSRAYRQAARERAPAALDERIRAQAREVPDRRRWRRPLATVVTLAATLALAVSLVLQVTAPPDGSVPSPADGPAPAQAADQARGAATPEAARPAQARSKAAAAFIDEGQALREQAQEPVSLHCAEHVSDAKAWHACITALEAAGEEAAAAREREAWESRHGRGAAVAN
jgi:hypothetical protein